MRQIRTRSFRDIHVDFWKIPCHGRITDDYVEACISGRKIRDIRLCLCPRSIEGHISYVTMRETFSSSSPSRSRVRGGCIPRSELTHVLVMWPGHGVGIMRAVYKAREERNAAEEMRLSAVASCDLQRVDICLRCDGKLRYIVADVTNQILSSMSRHSKAGWQDYIEKQYIYDFAFLLDSFSIFISIIQSLFVRELVEIKLVKIREHFFLCCI